MESNEILQSTRKKLLLLFFLILMINSNDGSIKCVHQKEKNGKKFLKDSTNDCQINVHYDMVDSEAFILSSKNPPNFVYPDVSAPSVITLKKNEPTRVVCGSSSNTINCEKTSSRAEKLSCEGQPPTKHISKPTKKGKLLNFNGSLLNLIKKKIK